MPVVVNPAQAVLALGGGGSPGSVLHHEAGAELVQEPGRAEWSSLIGREQQKYCALIGCYGSSLMS